MEVIKNFYQPWLEKWINHRFQAIILICLLVWTPILVAGTLQVQNSCNPMIHSSNNLLPKYCQNEGNNGTQKETDKSGKKDGNKMQELLDSIKQHPDLTGVSIGIGFATVATIANAPLVVVAGISIALWLAIRTALSP
ncbi:MULTISPECIES: hypothetical protein [unclassified Microcoleus]|uniref:hypothetical protein n=1 Tax=unclassified Microcoleus TaxID=2642155 RepID=UPI002FD6D804